MSNSVFPFLRVHKKFLHYFFCAQNLFDVAKLLIVEANPINAEHDQSALKTIMTTSAFSLGFSVTCLWFRVSNGIDV